MSNSTQRGAIGDSQSTNTSVTYSVMPEQIRNQLAGPTSNGGEFIVIQRTRQGEEPKVWSTGDKDLTEQLFRQAYTSLAFDQPVAA